MHPRPGALGGGDQAGWRAGARPGTQAHRPGVGRIRAGVGAAGGDGSAIGRRGRGDRQCGGHAPGRTRRPPVTLAELARQETPPIGGPLHPPARWGATGPSRGRQSPLPALRTNGPSVARTMCRWHAGALMGGAAASYPLRQVCDGWCRLVHFPCRDVPSGLAGPARGPGGSRHRHPAACFRNRLTVERYP